MVEIVQEKRSRGRPQVRSDEETRFVVTEAAGRIFNDMGYAATSVSDIAQSAGISTKTLYRLFPAKSDLFESVCAERIERFTLEANSAKEPLTDINSSLVHVLEAFGRLTLDADTIAINKLVVSEADRFPEVAAAFYKRAVLGTARVIEEWIEARMQAGQIEVEDVSLASGMLRGMMMFEPQRAVILGQREPPSKEEIGHRAEACAQVFLRGCLVRKI